MGFSVGKPVRLTSQVMEGLRQELDNQTVSPSKTLVLVLRNLPTRKKGVESVKDREVEYSVQRSEKVGIVRVYDRRNGHVDVPHKCEARVGGDRRVGATKVAVRHVLLHDLERLAI